MIPTTPTPLHTAAITAVLMLITLSLIGYRIIPRSIRPSKSWQRIPLSLSIGTTFTGVMVWTAGHIAGTTPAFIFAGVLLIISFSTFSQWFLDLHRSAKRSWQLICSAPAFATGTFAVFATLITPQLLLPAISSDGLRYHLALPKLYLIEGRVIFYPWDVHAAMPQAAEMIYMLMMPFGGGEAAKILHALFFLSTLFILMFFIHRDYSSRRAALGATFVFAATPAVLASAGAAFVDHFSLLHIAVACLLLRFRCHPLLIGAALAGAITTKWTAAPAVVGIAILTIWYFRHSQSSWIKNALLVSLPIIVAILPIATRNFVATGDPFYPIGMGLLRHEIPGVSPERFAYVTQVHSDIPGPLGIPWGTGIGDIQNDEIIGWHHLIGLLIAPLLIKKRSLWPAAALIVPYLLIGFHYHPSSRLSMPLLFGLAAFEGIALSRLGRWGPAIALALVAPALVIASSVQLAFGRPLDVLTGTIKRNDVQELIIPASEAAFFINRQTTGGTVMAMDFPAPYLFDRPWIAEGLVNESPIELWLKEDPSAEFLLTKMQQEQISHLVVTPGYGGGTSYSLVALGANPDQIKALLELRRHFVRIYSRNNVDVFRIEKTCRAPGYSRYSLPLGSQSHAPE